jgi:hypothetical protein
MYHSIKLQVFRISQERCQTRVRSCDLSADTRPPIDGLALPTQWALLVRINVVWFAVLRRCSIEGLTMTFTRRYIYRLSRDAPREQEDRNPVRFLFGTRRLPDGMAFKRVSRFQLLGWWRHRRWRGWGCGMDTVPGYFPHALQQASLGLIPGWLAAVFIGMEAAKLRGTDPEASWGVEEFSFEKAVFLLGRKGDGYVEYIWCDRIFLKKN